jgi:SAM-dependent methyltransferase
MKTMSGNTTKVSSKRHPFREKLLLFLSRKPGSDVYAAGQNDWTPENALSQLCRCFPGFLDRVAGKEILDFGCGTGYQSVALARMGAKHIVGFDWDKSFVEEAHQRANQLGLAGKVDFCAGRFDDSLRGRFDVVISQNSMEHFIDPAGVLNQMKQALKKDGVIFITFGPLWFAPYGSHMDFFVRIPWLNILFDENTVMTVRSHFNNDGATTYNGAGLSMMTVEKFEALIRKSELKVKFQRYDCVKGLDFLGKLPLIRELAVNQISCVVTK